MKHFFTYSIITIQNFALFIFSILAIIFYNCFNLDFYKNFYEKENLAPSINTTNSELIRKKLHQLDPTHEYIETIWGVGVRLKGDK